jgi:hypothetical protein
MKITRRDTIKGAALMALSASTFSPVLLAKERVPLMKPLIKYRGGKYKEFPKRQFDFR